MHRHTQSANIILLTALVHSFGWSFVHLLSPALSFSLSIVWLICLLIHSRQSAHLLARAYSPFISVFHTQKPHIGASSILLAFDTNHFTNEKINNNNNKRHHFVCTKSLAHSLCSHTFTHSILDDTQWISTN